MTDAPVHRVHFLRTAWFRYAAALLLIAGTAVILYRSNQPSKEIARSASVKQVTDILPGGNKAILTLSDGSTIVLDSVSAGNLAQQGNTKIIKLDAGSLAYSTGKADGKIFYNTITTPNGGQYQITLPDGSKVWLNAASSVRFPTAFTKERRVTVTGEAYFEIAPDRDLPFYVTADNLQVHVLGTGFNMNAYADEGSIATTLIEGSILIEQGKDRLLLKPGQQGMASTGPQDERSIAGNGAGNKNSITMVNADTDKVLAWKNGMFNFENATLQEVMRQAARWYNIEVVYPPRIPVIYFAGGMSRSLKLSGFLKALEEMNIHFKLEGRKLMILSSGNSAGNK